MSDARLDAPQGWGDTDLLLELRRLLGMVWRRKLIICGIIALGTLAAALYAKSLPNVYQAFAQVAIGTQTRVLTTGDELVQGLQGDEITVESELQVLRSQGLARAVIQGAGLAFDPAFNGSLAWDSDTASTGEITPAMLEALGSAVDVYQIGNSRVIEVSVESGSSDQAASIANTLLELYVEQQLRRKTAAIDDAAVFLGDRAEELRGDLEAAEIAAEEFRIDANLPDEAGRLALTDQLAQLEAQIAIARGDLAAEQARTSEIDRAVAAGRLDSLPEVRNAPTVQALREQEAQAAAALAEISTVYGPRHPTYQNAEAALNGIRSRIDLLITGIAETERSAIALSQARLDELMTFRAELTERINRYTRSEVEMRALEREVESRRDLFTSVQARQQQIEEQLRQQQADAEIISQATPPTKPSGPSRLIVVAAGLIVSGCVALLVAIGVEQMDRTVRGPEQAEQSAGIPVLASFPQLGRTSRIPPQDVPILQPTGRFGRAVRSSAFSLFPPVEDGELGDVVMFVSPDRGEGKTSLTVALGRALALEGRRAVVVDGNLTQPRLAEATGCPDETGVIDFLSEGSTLDSVLQIDPLSPLSLIPAGSRRVERLPGAGPMWRLMLEDLRQEFDIVLVDGPGLHDSPEAKQVAVLADGCVLVAHDRRTLRRELPTAVRELRSVQAPLSGLLLNHA